MPALPPDGGGLSRPRGAVSVGRPGPRRALARSVWSRGYFRSIQSRIGDGDIDRAECPVTIPNAITHANGRMTSPAKNNSASVAANAVAWVITERGSVSLTERLSVSYSGSCRFLRRFSRTRSKMMIVSFSEYPITVSIAATTVSETSRFIIFMNASVVRMSCAVAITAATPKRQSKRRPDNERNEERHEDRR